VGTEPCYRSSKGSFSVRSATVGVFTQVAVKYKATEKVIPVLILDNVNRLPGPILAQFQDFAKEASDKAIATLVFVSSEGSVPRRMQERSSWSRKQRILQIGDVSQKEALEYLQLRGIDTKLATAVYSLVGGWIILLRNAVNNLRNGLALDDIQQDLFNDAQATLAIAGVLPKYRFYGVGKEVIAELLDKGEISLEAYNGIIGNPEIADAILRENLFSYHLRTGRITFRSMPIEQYCRAKYGSGRRDD